MIGLKMRAGPKINGPGLDKREAEAEKRRASTRDRIISSKTCKAWAQLLKRLDAVNSP